MYAYIWTLLFIHAPMYGIDPHLAAAVVQTESTFNPNAIGALNEVGLFQIRPEFSKRKAHELLDPEVNIVEGLMMMQKAKVRCKYQKRKMFVICMNLGISGASKIKRPLDHPYYRKVYSTYLAYSRNK